MALKRVTDYGESLKLTASTRVLSDGVCYAIFSSGAKLIRKSMFGYGPEGFKRADDAVQSLVLIAGATRIHHSTNECDRRHSGRMCNTNDATMSASDKALR